MVTFPISGVETYWWLPALVAFIISYFSSMGGVSGSFLLMPFQVSVLGFTSPAVSPTNLLFNVFGIPGGVYRYIRENRLVWPLVITILIGNLPGMIIGTCIRVLYFSNPSNFKLFVGIVLMYVGVRLVLSILGKPEKVSYIKNGDFAVKMLTFNARKIEYEFNGSVFKASTLYIFILALAVGIIASAYGFGGGVIMAPFLVTIFGLPVHTVAGAALMANFVFSLAGLVMYSLIIPVLLTGQQAVTPDWLLGVSLGVGGMVGIYLGARMQRYFPPEFIKIILVVLIAIVVTKYVGGYFL